MENENTLNVNGVETCTPDEEVKATIKVYSFTGKEKMKKGDIRAEKEGRIFTIGDMFCGLDNHRCDGSCYKRNIDKSGNLICSEVISRAALPGKKRKKKKLFSDRRDRDSDDNFSEHY